MILRRVEMLLCPGIACGHIDFARNGIWFWTKYQPVISCLLLQLQKRWFTGVPFYIGYFFFSTKRKESTCTGGAGVSGCGVVVVLRAPGNSVGGGGRYCETEAGKAGSFLGPHFLFPS